MFLCTEIQINTILIIWNKVFLNLTNNRKHEQILKQENYVFKFIIKLFICYVA